MSGEGKPLVPAVWTLNDQGVPYSDTYGDVYHSRAGALAQARHVFLAGNGLPHRWQARPAFTICEAGFGLGQNFLATWQAWRDDPARCTRLHYVAFEAHPFTRSDLRQAWQGLPDAVGPLARELADQWPPLLPGLHVLALAGDRVTLTLAFGPIERLALQLEARVDAFFLDGFAPAANPAMWSPRLFGQLRRMAAVGATAATWCVAGQVRRDLSAAGFLVSKAPGFGAKREMTVAVLRPGLGRALDEGRSRRVAIVGAGLAGASIAQALARRGHGVAVWDPGLDGSLPRTGTALPAAALVPALSPDDDTRSRITRAGLARAWACWRMLPPDARPDACGALVCAPDLPGQAAQQAMLRRLQFPADWVAWADEDRARRLTGLCDVPAGLWFPDALRVCPVSLRRALLAWPGIVRHRARVVALRQAPQSGWLLLDESDHVLDQADLVVLANAQAAPDLLGTVVDGSSWPVLAGLVPIAGQLSLYAAPDGAHVPNCIVTGDGYCLPARNGWAALGSTYRVRAPDCQPDAAGQAEVLARIGRWLDLRQLPWSMSQTPVAWGGWRAATRDHLPVIGAVPDVPGLWLACAYGSRGLSWSALAGELIAASLSAEPLPLERELLHRIRVR